MDHGDPVQMKLLSLDTLLTGDSLFLTLTSTSVGLCSLAAAGETLAVAIAAVGLDVLEALNVLLNLAAESTFDQEVGVDHVVDFGNIGFVHLNADSQSGNIADCDNSVA